MSDIQLETPVETPKVNESAPSVAPKPKQYLMVTDEITMIMMSKIIPGLQFVEVQGMAMKDNDTHFLLVNPKPQPQVSNEAPKASEEPQQSC